MAVEFVEKKLISNMIISYSGDIVNCVQKYRNSVGVLAVVNAANPTLMGSLHKGVDASIHEAIDSKKNWGQTLWEMNKETKSALKVV